VLGGFGKFNPKKNLGQINIEYYCCFDYTYIFLLIFCLINVLVTNFDFNLLTMMRINISVLQFLAYYWKSETFSPMIQCLMP